MGGSMTNEFEWTKDIVPFNIRDRKWIIEIANEQECVELERFLFGLGWWWGGIGEQKHLDYEPCYSHFFPERGEGFAFDAAAHHYFDNDYEWDEHRSYKWSVLRVHLI